MIQTYNFKSRGIGIISSKPITQNTFIGNYFTKFETITTNSRLIYNGWIETNPFGRYLNHNRIPNCNLILENDTIKICTNRNINELEELTVNYMYVISLIELPIRLTNKYGVYDFDYMEEEIIIKNNLL
jgi:hypothetical protein